MDEKAIANVDTNSPAAMIRMAVEGKADLEKLEKLLGLQERWEANEAKKAYFKAMAFFKANPPKIDKDKQVAFGNTKYSHASLANVTEKVSAELSKYGLSASWSTKQNGAIAVTCRITHELGYSEETTISAPADKSGSKNDIQSIGSTITYLERYTLLALTGLATSDMDDDGRAAGLPVEFITAEQVTDISNRITAIGKKFKLDQFLKYMGVEETSMILKTDFQKAIVALTQAAEEKKKVSK